MQSSMPVWINVLVAGHCCNVLLLCIPSYSLVSNGDGKFDIDSATGQVSTAVELDREDTESYTLVAMAMDFGSLPHSSTVTVTVSVLDANDNSPVFREGNYNVYIRDPTTAG